MSSTESELARTFNEDVVERYARHFIEHLIATLRIPDDEARLLDLACGTGFGTIPLLDALPESSIIVALSDDRFVLKEFHRVLDGRLRARIFPRKENLSRLPFADATFDLACACLPCRLWEPPQPVLREVFRVLRPGGAFAVCVPLRGSFFELQGAICSSGDGDDQLAMQRVLAQSTRLADADEWLKLISRSGGSDVRLKRSTFKLIIEPPASKDRLIALHLLPLWLSEGEKKSPAEALDTAILEPLKVTVHVGCIAARRASDGDKGKGGA